jgi:hypothetical protein
MPASVPATMRARPRDEPAQIRLELRHPPAHRLRRHHAGRRQEHAEGGADDVPPDVISAISSAGESTPSALQKLTCVDDGDGFVVAAAQVDRPADQLAGAEVDDRVKVDPTVLRGSHLGHVDMPQIVRADDPEQPRPPAPVTVAGPLQQPVRAGTTGRRTATTQTTGTAGFPAAWTGPAGVAVRSRGGRGAAGTAASSWSR